MPTSVQAATHHASSKAMSPSHASSPTTKPTNSDELQAIIIVMIVGAIGGERHSSAGLSSISRQIVRPLTTSSALVSALLCVSQRPFDHEFNELSNAVAAGGGVTNITIFSASEGFERTAKCFAHLESLGKVDADFIVVTRPDICLCSQLPPIGTWARDAVSARARIYVTATSFGRRPVVAHELSTRRAVLGIDEDIEEGKCPFDPRQPAPCLVPDDQLYIVPFGRPKPWPHARHVFRAQRHLVANQPKENRLDGCHTCASSCREAMLGRAWTANFIQVQLLMVCAYLDGFVTSAISDKSLPREYLSAAARRSPNATGCERLVTRKDAYVRQRLDCSQTAYLPGKGAGDAFEDEDGDDEQEKQEKYDRENGLEASDERSSRR